MGTSQATPPFDDPLPDSSDLSGSPAPNDGVRRGPPPPSPVNRSRSPRRRGHMRSAASNISISLAAALAPPTFDLTRNCLKVPGDFALIQQLLAPWAGSMAGFSARGLRFQGAHETPPLCYAALAGAAAENPAYCAA